MGSMNSTSDLGEPDFEPDAEPNEALLDAEKTIASLTQERNLLRLRVAEAEMQCTRMNSQVVDITGRFTAFKAAVALVMKELTRD